MTDAARRIDTTPTEALGVVALCFGWAIYASLSAVARGYPATRGFTDAGMLVLLAIELAFGGLALGLLRRRGYDVASLVPRVTWSGALIGLGLAVLGLMLVEIMVIVCFTAAQSQQPYAQMMRASSVSVPMVLLVAVVNGTFEEVVLLGFLQRGLRAYGASIAVGVVLLVRVLCHLYQGPVGASAMLAYGGVVGLYYARWRNAWPAVFAHIIWDIVPFLA